MADKKITELTTASAITANTMFVVVIDPAASNPNTQSINATALFGSVVVPVVASANITSNATVRANNFVIFTSNTPANSTITIEKGKMFYDSDYLYIAVANNTLKRISLTSF